MIDVSKNNSLESDGYRYVSCPMLSKKKFILAATGRFYLLDLAKELLKQGHEVEFFSIIPSWRAEKFGLPKSKLRSLFWYTFPLLIIERISKGKRRQKIQRLLARYCDYLICQRLTYCDFFIGMSGLFGKSQVKAKHVFSATTICERGSTHVLAQQKALSSAGINELSLDETVVAELDDYQNYDIISIPSLHVADSFSTHGVDAKKIMINPYGVDLTSFKLNPTNTKTNSDQKALFVGRWGLRKGADLMSLILHKNNISLTHIGPVDDFPLPQKGLSFCSIGVVEQNKLSNHYNNHDFFILLSREEGLALVQAQALACGLPILCSQFTGGRDLKQLIDVPDAIVEVDIADYESISKGLKKVRSVAAEMQGQDLLGNKGRSNLTWHAYTDRYLNILEEKYLPLAAKHQLDVIHNQPLNKP